MTNQERVAQITMLAEQLCESEEMAQSVLNDINRQMAERQTVIEGLEQKVEAQAALSRPVTIAELGRYQSTGTRFRITKDGTFVLDPDEEGNWVRYRDYSALEAQVKQLREALEAARDVLSAFQKKAGWIPQQKAYSSKMTEDEMQLARAVQDIDDILARAALAATDSESARIAHGALK